MNAVWRSIVRADGSPGVLVSEQVRRWRRVAEVEVLMQRVPRRSLAVSVALDVRAFPPDTKRRRDLDNVLKAALDLLTRSRVLADDSFIDELHVERMVPNGAGRLELTVRPRSSHVR